MKPVLGKILKYGVPPVITVGLCYILFHNQDLPGMVRYVRDNCNFGWILASMGLIAITFVIRAMRWRIQLRASNVYAPLHAVTYSVVGTYAVNMVFPRLGEVWRAEYIARRQGSRFPTVLGSVLAERMTDTLTVLLLLFATCFLAGDAVKGFIHKYPAAYRFLSDALTSPWTYLAVVALAAFCVWFLHRRAKGKITLKIQTFCLNILQGLMAIFHMKGAWKWGLLTVLLWCSYYASMVCCFMAFGFTREMLTTHGLVAPLVCYVLASVAMGIPSNGGIGPYQAAAVFALGFFVVDLDTEMALGFANTVLGAQILTIILCGIPTFIAIAFESRRRKPSKVKNVSKS